MRLTAARKIETYYEGVASENPRTEFRRRAPAATGSEPNQHPPAGKVDGWNALCFGLPAAWEKHRIYFGQQHKSLRGTDVQVKNTASTRGRAFKPRLRKIRRIVTGHDAQGRSVFVSDASSPHVMTLQGIPTFGVTEIWKTDSTPADNRAAKDPCKVPAQLAPPKRGTVIRVVEFPPDKLWIKSADRDKAFASMGSSGAKALAHDASASRHPMMHRTQTIDYAIILSGEIWALMDNGETKMKAGDILIQRGTNHAWSNRSNKPCLVAFALIDAKPLN